MPHPVIDRGEHRIRGGHVRFEVRDELVVSLDAAGARARLALPYPRAGYGGHALVVSPDEDHVALYLFSGQSEQGWELFALRPALRHVGGLAYVEGCGDAPRFSPDGRWLAMLVATTPRVVATGACFEDVSTPDADDAVLVEWARLYVHRLGDEQTTRHPVTALVPRAVAPDEVNAWSTYDAMRFPTPTDLEVTTPWGERLTCRLPVASVPVATYAPTT